MNGQRRQIAVINLLPPSLCNGIKLGGAEDTLDLREAETTDPSPLSDLIRERLGYINRQRQRRRRSLELQPSEKGKDDGR